jgi:predicted Zn-dependent peptidase
MRPDLAQQTFEVTIGELRRLAKGIEPDEMTRSHTQLRSSLVMQGESTSARANALASDWYHLGRLRSLEEVSRAIEAVTIPDVLDYLRAFPAENFTVLVIGPKPLDTGALEAGK